MKKAIIILLAMLLAISTVAGIISRDSKSDEGIVNAVVGNQNDEYLCSWEATDSQIDCDSFVDVSGECTSNTICGGGHTHPASQVTAGTFGAGDYVFPADVNITTDMSVGQDLAIGDDLRVVGQMIAYGELIVDSDEGNKAAYITRNGGKDQSLKMWADDNTAYIQSIQDEGTGAYGNIEIRIGSQVGQSPLLRIVDYGGNGKITIDEDGNISTVGSLTGTTLNTGQGDYELYQMNQNVHTGANVQFATVNTGQGANELYDMDQNVLTTSDVNFGEITATNYGDTPIWAITDDSEIMRLTSDYSGLARVFINNNASGDGDSGVSFAIDGTSMWTIGPDDSDGNNFKITKGYVLGTDDALEVSGDLNTEIKHNLSVDENIFLGDSEADQYLYFYEDGSPTGEYSGWANGDDRFVMSDSLHIGGTFDADDDIYTGAFRANATGNVKMNNLTMAGSISVTRYASGACRIVNSTGIFDEVVCSQ